VSKVSRKLYGVTGEGLKLKANHRYRVVGEYDNPTGKTLVKGAMAHMVGLFVPDDMSKWPAIDPSDPTYQRDLASLEVRGGVNEMEGMHHGGDRAERSGSQHGEMQMDHSNHTDHAPDADHQAAH
jgi:hypothetical protein